MAKNISERFNYQDVKDNEIAYILAYNDRPPSIQVSVNWITTTQLKTLSQWIMEVANRIENDPDFRNK